MQKKLLFLFLLAAVASKAMSQAVQVLAPEKEDDAPALFASGVVSTPADEFGITFTPDEKTCFFAMKTASTIRSSIFVICFSDFVNGQWTMPSVAPFSGVYKDFNPFISPDGSKLFFVSNRPVAGRPGRDTDIWFVEKKNAGWSDPVNIGVPVNTPGWELGCSVSANGNLYFSAIRDNGGADIYFAAYENGKYTAPVKLDSAINSPANEGDPFIAPDESYIIFSSLGRTDAMHSGGADSYPRSDLYISFKKNGGWTPAEHLEHGVNSIAEESNPYVSPVSKLLFFTSERNFVSNPMKKKLSYAALENGLQSITNGLGNIYSISINKIIADSQVK